MKHCFPKLLLNLHVKKNPNITVLKVNLYHPGTHFHEEAGTISSFQANHPLSWVNSVQGVIYVPLSQSFRKDHFYSSKKKNETLLS